MIENNWWQLYRTAVFEINRTKLLDRVKAAEDAIRARASLGELVSSEERDSIQDAMATLLILRRELAQSPVARIKHRQHVWGKNMGETPIEVCGKCDAEIDSTRRVDFTLTNGTRVCEPCFEKETRRPKSDWPN
jgi:hypothetical protein